MARLGNPMAVAHANHGAGRSPDLSRLARGVKERELALSCAAATLHVAGRSNAVADARSRFSLDATGGDLCPDREIRSRFRAQVEFR